MERIGEYKLNRVIGGVAYYARVWVRVVDDDTTEVTVDPGAFAWLKDVYGPDAWQWSISADYCEGARQGCRYALEHLDISPATPLHVHVLGIHAHPAHSTQGSVRMAACLAVWRALDDGARDCPELLD